MILEYIKKEDDFFTVRQVVTNYFNISSVLRIKLHKNNKIFLNGLPTYLDRPIVNGDVITIVIDFEEDNSNVLPNDIPLNILYEDDFILALDKPSGLPVHPSVLHFSDSLSNGVKYYFDKINLHKKIRPVNRLDKNTSGIVIFAKNEYIHDILSKQMQNKIFKKTYIAVCEGIFEDKVGTIDVPISRKENSIIERCVSPLGDSSITHYKVINEISGKFSVLEISLETGRTHQIRVHMSYIGHPIVGDSLYGNESSIISRQALHAYKVEFLHPVTHQSMILKAPIPSDILGIIRQKK